MRIFFCGLFLLLTNSTSLQAADEPKRLVALVDYIGGDYRNAVEGAKIVNQIEYDEMLEFATRSLEIFKQLKANEGGRDTAGIEKDLQALASHIKEKSGEKVVPDLAQQIKERLIATYKIVTHPKTLPDVETAKVVYIQNCAQCHGATGRGDGSDAATMRPREPRPANFHDKDLMAGLSPFKAFNTTTFGIQGTGMPNFSALSEADRWQAAFYVLSLRFSLQQSSAGKTLFEAKKPARQFTDVATLATTTDGELTEKLSALFPAKEESEKVLAYLRRGLLEERKPDPLLRARAYLGEALDFYRQGKKQEAYQRSVDAYLDGFELAEPALFAKDASFGRELESRFTEFRSSIRRGDDITRIRELHSQLETRLARAAEILRDDDAASGTYTLFNAALIILREGLEAALIVSAIIAVLKTTGAVEAIRYVHLGWGLALVSGLLTWAMAQTVITVSGAQREIIEGFTSIFAALVLFSVSYWLISKIEAKKWQQYIQHKVQEALTVRRVAAFVGVSFLAVYREAFETVLFYQALWLQSPSTQNFVICGLLVGLALLAVVVWSIFKLGLKIPLRLFFGISSALLYLLAFVFAGDGIKNIQAAGWFSETPVQHLPRIPVLGIYPTVETLSAQGVIALALIFALLWVAKGPARANTR
ncbi:MAG: cytochrome c/FTR1 family iron permease [Deltaproteobacteria bacterium]|nr:cytochrome c/FTR1 family iron permease [Deltaproteobacteria bacterium]